MPFPSFYGRSLPTLSQASMLRISATVTEAFDEDMRVILLDAVVPIDCLDIKDLARCRAAAAWYPELTEGYWDAVAALLLSYRPI